VHPEQRDASFRLDFHDFEAPLETVGERLEIVIEIVEHAFRMIEPKQGSRGAVRLYASAEYCPPNSTASLFITGLR